MDPLTILTISIYTFSFVLSIVTGTAIFYLKLYHGNLRILLMNVSFTHCFALILAITTEFSFLFEIKWDGLKMIDRLTVLCIWAVAFNLVCLFCERLVASKLDKRYETMCIGLPWLGAALAMLDWLIAILFAILDFGNIVENTILAIIALIIITISLILFSFMPSLTYKRYMHATTESKEFSLSQRYQMAENYRSAKLLTKAVWCFGITSILAGILFILSRIGSNHQIFETLYPFAFLAQGIFYPFLVMYYESKVRDFVLCQKSRRVFIAKSITGKDLIISNVNDQREAYFKSYKQAWS